MYPRILTLTVGLFLLVSVPARAQVLVYEVFGAYLDSLRDQAGIPGLSAAIVDSYDIVWERAYGHQDTGRFIGTRTDTPFHADGLTQVFTAAIALRCAEEGRLSLDDRIGSFRVESLEPDATIRQLLTHTSGAPENLVFAHRPQRLEPLWRILRTCTDDSYRESLANLFKQLAMFDSAPGANILTIVPPAEGVPLPEDVERYAGILQRRATPYVVDDRGRAVQSAYPESASALTPSSGIVTTVRDLAKFDLALRQGILVTPDTLAQAWTPPSSNGVRLPHGMGWFVQQYGAEPVVWQFGMTENASSSLMITLPSRGLTLILMANSDGLVKLYSPANGDISLSPFARLFLNLFAR
ncbi:MAG TPA: serine hydrolase domain-containing protein [Vicinamibacterales bacterium]|nr:serine hydrolase domain-containing protein [Vicinamibacterales bacterium]